MDDFKKMAEARWQHWIIRGKVDLITMMSNVSIFHGLLRVVFASCPSIITNSAMFHSWKCPGFDNKSLVILEWNDQQDALIHRDLGWWLLDHVFGVKREGQWTTVLLDL